MFDRRCRHGEHGFVCWFGWLRARHVELRSVYGDRRLCRGGHRGARRDGRHWPNWADGRHRGDGPNGPNGERTGPTREPLALQALRGQPERLVLQARPAPGPSFTTTTANFTQPAVIEHRGVTAQVGATGWMAVGRSRLFVVGGGFLHGELRHRLDARRPDEPRRLVERAHPAPAATVTSLAARSSRAGSRETPARPGAQVQPAATPDFLPGFTPNRETTWRTHLSSQTQSTSATLFSSQRQRIHHGQPRRTQPRFSRPGLAGRRSRRSRSRASARPSSEASLRVPLLDGARLPPG